jgi:hypothetical protein
VRQSTKKTISIFLGASLSVLSLKFFFPTSSVDAQLIPSSVDKCLKDPICVKWVMQEGAKAAVGTGVPAAAVLNGQPVGDAAAPTVVVDSQGRVYYWSNAINQRAQALAQETFCSVYPKDKLCGELFQGGQGDGVLYEIVTKITEPHTGTTTYQSGMVFGPIGGARYHVWNQDFGSAGVLTNYQAQILSRGIFIGGSPQVGYPHQYQWWYYTPGGSGGFFNGQWGNIGLSIVSVRRVDGQPDTAGNPRPYSIVDWPNWSESQRQSAIESLTNGNWQELIAGMPVGGTLKPGERVSASQIIVLGGETDDPNTPEDERQTRVVSGTYTLPVAPPVPTPTPTLSPSPTPTPEPTPSPSPTLPPPPPPIPSPLPSPTPIPSPNPTPTPPPYEFPDELERELNEAQKNRILERIAAKKLKPEYVDGGELRPITGDKQKRKCFYMKITPHLGEYEDHGEYATEVTGSPSDLAVVSSEGNYAYYDGELTVYGTAARYGLENPGAVAEVKTDQSWLIRYYAAKKRTTEDRLKYSELHIQLYYQALVARQCRLRYFIAFAKEEVAKVAKPNLEKRYRPASVYYIPFDKNNSSKQSIVKPLATQLNPPKISSPIAQSSELLP